MLTFLVYTRTAWDDYFIGNPTLKQTKEYGTSQTLSDVNVYISDCLFRSITSGSNGGALSCTSVQCLLIELSSFISCKTSSNFGGAIYFYNTNSGQFVLYGVCGNDCFSTYTSGTSYGQFSYNRAKNDASTKNYVNYSSIVRCVTDNSRACYLFCQHWGNHSYPSVNVSMNKIYGPTGIHCWPLIDSNSVTCLISYSSFVDNIATGHTCIYFNTDGAKYEIRSCNILRNTQGSLSSEGTIYTCGNLMIEDSCIIENKATYIFRVVSSSYKITLSKCTVDSTSNNGCLITQNAVTKSFIHALDHLSTRNCHSEYDSVEYITPITQLSKIQIHCYTGQKCFYQCQLSEVVSLHNILIFNFIHPYASIDKISLKLTEFLTELLFSSLIG
jgi:hypothetical protein